jgi:tetratricopeptide (TPR) repeat protein
MGAAERIRSHDLHGGSAMSTTLNLADRLLSLARTYHDLGRTHDAQRILARLSAFRELPPPVAEETQARLAEIHLDSQRFSRARRHLTAALGHQPKSARYHHLMAQAIEADPKSDPQRAAEHARRSLELEPDQPDCLCEAGLLAIRLGQTEEGIAQLRRAVELRPEDPDILARLVEGLHQAGRTEEARKALRLALFRNGRDRRLRKLWNGFQFDQLRREQETSRLQRTGRADDGPVILPFIRIESGDAARDRVRHDGPASLPSPHAKRPTGRHTRRHIQ